MVSLSETFYVVVVFFFALFSSFAGVLKFHQQNGCTTSASTKFKVDALFKKAICMSEPRIKTQITNSGAVKMAIWEKTYMKLIRCHAQKEIDCFRFSSFYLMHIAHEKMMQRKNAAYDIIVMLDVYQLNMSYQCFRYFRLNRQYPLGTVPGSTRPYTISKKMVNIRKNRVTLSKHIGSGAFLLQIYAVCKMCTPLPRKINFFRELLIPCNSRSSKSIKPKISSLLLAFCFLLY